MKRRLFIGNLAPTVEQEELRDKFLSLMSGHQDARVGNVEVRCKNGDNYFGFVDIHVDNDESPAGPPPFLRKCIDLMNNTKWKGSLIKVQLAKESFLDQLKRERQSKAGEPPAVPVVVHGKKVVENPEIQSQKKILADLNRYSRPKRPPVEVDALPRESDNFDFEIVSNKLSKKDKATCDESKSSGDESEEESPDGIPKFRGLRLAYPQGMGLNSEVSEVLTEPQIQRPQPLVKPKPQPIQVDPSQQRILRIAGYSIASQSPNSQPPPSVQPQFPRHTKFQEKSFPEPPVVPVVDDTQSVTTTPPTKGVVFKKNRQQNSDLLRQQSLDNRGVYGIKNQQLGIIKSSLANINNNMNFHETTGEARPKMDSLFGEDGDNQEEYENDFRPKKQFEGAAGQKLLELRGQWGFDERFKIDERFNNNQDNGEDDQNVLSSQDEKNKQLGILSDLLGTPVQFQPKKKQESGKNKSNYNPVIQSRYDPDFPNQEMGQMDIDEGGFGQGLNQKRKQADKLKNKEPAPPDELIRSTEPATYKTASNLKSLFSEDSKELTQGSFSLLATFGREGDIHETMDQDNSSTYPTSNPADGAPRQFWQSNPFKYDSSDDEDDEKSANKAKGKALAQKKPLAFVAPRPLSEFFFTKNDKRLIGLQEFFLKRDETEERIDYDEKRKELKSIVKAKARNAKRKDDKRTLAIKRSIRKRKKYKKTAISSSSSNAVSVRHTEKA